MSRTDVHTPNRVKSFDPAWRDHFYEHHNHERGACDLAKYRTSRGEARTRCWIGWDWRGRNVFCGCRMCTQQVERLLETRRRRYDARRRIRRGDWDRL